MVNTNQTQTVVKFGDTFYLKNKSGQYLIGADSGRYFFPQLDNSGKTPLQLKGKTGELQHNDEIKIRSLETRLGDRDVLGAFPDSHNCYYWNDGYDERKQGWKITKASGEPGKICYGDEVYLTNVYYDNQTLATDTKYPGYLTTVKNAKQIWILESTKKIPVTDFNAPKAIDVFDLSVASGDPTPTGVILWTRVNPEAHEDDIPLKYQVSLTRSFDDPFIQGTVEASDIIEKNDYTVKIDLDTKLESNKAYFYRFTYGEATSPIGRCRTLPAEKEQLTEPLRLGVVTCNDYSSGYFNAFYHLAEEDIDFVVHLGDFVYEYPRYPDGYGEIIRTDLMLTENEYPTLHPDKNIDRTTSLKDFYHVYRTYRRDPALQRAMENHTWIITLDDHEIADNCYWDYANNTMSVSVDEPLHPIQENLGKDSVKAKEAMKQLYKNATLTWSKYIPARLEEITEQEPPYKLYRHFSFGSLIDFYLTDSRSFRDKPDLEINQQILAKVKEHQAVNPNAKITDVMKSVRQEMRLKEWQASMLGKDQREWLIKGVTNSDAKWKVWGNQTLLATSTMNEMIGEIDDWHGFKAERYEILQAVKEHETEKYGDDTSRFVVLTGDMHTSLIAYLKTETDSLASDAGSEILGNFGSAIKNTGKGLWSGATLDLSSAMGSLGEGAKDFKSGAANVLGDVGSSIMNPLETGQKIAEDTVNNANLDFKKLAGVEFMTPAVTSPGLSEYIYVGAEGVVDGIEEKLGINFAPVTETVGAAVSSALGTASSFLGSLIPDVSDRVSTHKLTTASAIKSLSPHIEHFDSSVNGYAIAEFTIDKMRWEVYAIDKTIYDKSDDGHNLSTNRAEKKLVQSAIYDPDGIRLDD
ncbi:MAG: alkaline phosphatase D family protein [Cyanobacteria bacterium P01_A01_bin.83]